MVESTREIGGKVSRERRNYLCSMIDVTRIALTIRHHWAIENRQHIGPEKTILRPISV